MSTSDALYRYRFGSAEFDESRFELRVAGALVEVQHKPLQLLALLLARAGQAVARDDLYDAVWGQRVTVEHVLANAVSKLRAALGPVHAARLVTVPRLGYRFDGPVERVAVAPVPEREAGLEEGSPVPGRADCTLVQRLGHSPGRQTWLARGPALGGPEPGGEERRVFKFASSQAQLSALKREVTVARLLEETLGPRDDRVALVDWSFQQLPGWIEWRYAGVDLAAWAAADGGAALAALSTPARLGLFLQLADAVAACHGVGVLHRDLKPRNVMVQELPGGARLRLADFGSARLLDPERLEALRITRLGMTGQPAAGEGDASGAVAGRASGGASGGGSGSGPGRDLGTFDSGTPLYMAPEVAAGAAPSASGDVYALGVMLYQLLVGDLRRLPTAGWEREIDDPLLREDIGRAIDGDPSHRLASAAELARRLRGLEHRRTEARASAEREAEAASTREQLARARARRPWAATSLALLAAALAVSVGWGLWMQRQAGASAAAQAASAEELARLQAHERWLGDGLLGAVRVGDGPFVEPSVREALLAAALSIEERFATEPEGVRAALHASAQAALAASGQGAAAVQAGRRALALRAADPALRWRVALTLASDLAELGRGDEAAAALADASLGPGPDDAPARARRLWAEAAVAQARADGDVLARLQAARAAAERAGDPAVLDRATLAVARWQLDAHEAPQAHALLQDLLAQQRRRLGDANLSVARSQLLLGRALLAQGRPAQALEPLKAGAYEMFDQLGGGRSAEVRDAFDLLAGGQLLSGAPAEAERNWGLVRGWRATAEGEFSSGALLAQAHAALARQRGGDAAGAEVAMREAGRRLAVLIEPDVPQAQYQRLLLAECLLARGGGAAGEIRQLLSGLDAQALDQAATPLPEPAWSARLERLRARVARLR